MPAAAAWCLRSHARHSFRDRGVICPASVFVVLVVVLCGRRVEFPALLVAIADLLLALQFLVVFVLDPEGPADVVDDVLVRGGVVAAGRFVTNRVRGFPVGVDISAGY